MAKPSISDRGLKLAQSIPRIDLEVYFEALQNLFDAQENYDGALPLNMAENRLSWNLLQDKIQQIVKANKAPHWVAGYTHPLGEASVRKSVADFLSMHLTDCLIDHENIGLSAGASSIIELTSYLLANRGDIAVIPAPSYPVYTQDLGAVSGLVRYDLITHHELNDAQNLRLNISHLEHSLMRLTSQGKKFRMLILTQPDNPTGIIYSPEQLDQFADWCISHEVHLVVNEIYGLSQLDTSHPSIKHLYKNPQPFFSFAKIMAKKESPYLHLWYAFSKDFGISGFRIGLIYSMNEWLLKGFSNLNLGHMVSNYVQWILREILLDTEFVSDYIRINQQLLTESLAVVITKMQSLDIPFITPRGSLFLWIDLSEFLSEQTLEAENKLWMNIYQSTGILLTPGAGFGHSKHGQFRIVYTFLQKADLEVAMDKLEGFVRKNRNSKTKQDG